MCSCLYSLLHEMPENWACTDYRPCIKGRKNRYSTRYKYIKEHGCTRSTAVGKHNFNEELTLVNTFTTVNDEEDVTNAPDILVDPSITTDKHASSKKRQPEIQLKRSTTLRKTHDIETAEVIFFDSGSEDEDTRL